VDVNDAGASQVRAETVLMIGGGMAGLSLALALEGSGKQVVIIERDAAPPEGLAPEDAFENWKRPGVWQFRYPHVFIGRLQGLMRTRYPQLFEELKAAGLRTSEFSEGLPPALRPGYAPEPEDDLMVSLCGRRATFEYVVRRYLARMPHVRFEHGAVATGLIGEQDAGALRVVGVEIKRGDAHEVLRGDVVVDAAGRNSPVSGLLEKIGGKVEVQRDPSNFLYFARHYHMRKGEVEPPRRDISADLDFLKFAIFYAEHGHFAIAFGCAEDEADMVSILRRPDSFDAMCAQIPTLVPWLSRSDAVTKVLGAAKIANRRSRIAQSPRVTGMFLSGDAGFEANPIYGRGCAAAFVQSHLLAKALISETDHERREAVYEAGLQAEVQPYHQASIWADQLFHVRAVRSRGQPVPMLRRLQMWMYENMVVPAVLVDMFLAREILKVMSMVDPAGPVRVMRFALHVILRVFSGRGRAAAAALPPTPVREKLLERIAVPVETEPGEVELLR
jgi:2-polyprenyl-6-methoxyphenol hydroxylase-like FAD-dependent oxidoreductase